MQEVVWQYFQSHQRAMPWRQPAADGQFDPYHILVSEIMLQQTQVSRVIPKYEAFMAAFPTVEALAAAPLAAVLRAWSGLGYNRRAKYLHQAAQAIAQRGSFPNTVAELTQLPGVGANTAAAILNYAFNQPTPFLETNIRTVYIHFFFADQADTVSDKQLLPLVKETMDREHPREWFWALMDYGAHLKATDGNYARRSRHYAKQSKFEGSRRQLRGKVLRSLGQSPQTLQRLAKQIPDSRLPDVLNDLLADDLISRRRTMYNIGHGEG